MNITVLIENTSESELISEHGLSLWIEYGEKKILLDAGSSEAFAENAKKLGIELERADICVLSHGHYDHCGGFEVVFQKNANAMIYAQKSAVESYYSGSGGIIHEISIPQNVLAYRDRFILVDGYKEICEGIYLVPHSTLGLEKIGERSKLYKKVEDTIVADDFSHEQSLVIDTENGLVVFNSCSHGGVENIMREVKEACGGKHIYAYIGGLHMKGKVNGEDICTFSESEVDDLCDVIMTEGMEGIYTGHCTGIPGFVAMQKRLGEKIKPLGTGMKFIL